MPYIAGFVAPVPAQNKDAYLKHASEAMDYFRSLGVTRAVEAWGDDVPEGKITDMARAVALEDGEVVVFAWHEYPDRAAYKAAQEKMQTDMPEMGSEMPFDASRMIYGGFDVITDHGNGEKGAYVDGSLLAVPRAARTDYQAYAKAADELILAQGALRVLDSWSDDVPDGEVTDFRRAVQATAEEDLVFSFIEWTSKAARDAAWQTLYADPRMHEIAPPHDEARRVGGGFVPILDA